MQYETALLSLKPKQILKINLKYSQQLTLI